MRKGKLLIAAASIIIIFVLLPMVAFAASDIDFTLDIDTTKDYMASQEILLPIVIKTQTDNGYTDLELIVKYNTDIFTPANAIGGSKDEALGFTSEV